VASRWLALAGPGLRYSSTRDAYVLRGVGSRFGPVLREDRRTTELPRAQGERRRAHLA
jgi:hypothetical protein